LVHVTTVTCIECCSTTWCRSRTHASQMAPCKVVVGHCFQGPSFVIGLELFSLPPIFWRRSSKLGRVDTCNLFERLPLSLESSRQKRRGTQPIKESLRMHPRWSGSPFRSTLDSCALNALQTNAAATRAIRSGKPIFRLHGDILPPAAPPLRCRTALFVSDAMVETRLASVLPTLFSLKLLVLVLKNNLPLTFTQHHFWG
jgi:hypothetical protein